MSVPVLKADHIEVAFRGKGADVQAVRDVSFHVDKGEILGIVGESGSGKSVLMKSVIGILPENARRSAEAVWFEGQDLMQLPEKEYRKIRGNRMAMIFQDPMTALNPLKKVGAHMQEVICRYHSCSRSEARKKAIEILRDVGISNPEKRVDQYPHELSGGMRQRVMIGMALCCEPSLLIADEPTTALDVTIQAQILELLKEKQENGDMSIVFITHDMGVVASICTRVMVMYGGKIMETGSTAEIFYEPRHPYTKALLEAVPRLDLEDGKRLVYIEGLPPSLTNPPAGCPFAQRCRYAKERCSTAMPEAVSFSDTHWSYCFYAEALKEDGGDRDE